MQAIRSQWPRWCFRPGVSKPLPDGVSGQLSGGLLISLLLLLGGCDNPQTRGFVLPPGDVEAGQQAFVDSGCSRCHSVAGAVEHSPIAEEGTLHVPLGGEVKRIQTYGELVTSLVHPNHRLARPVLAPMVSEVGESKMPNFNSIMTVQQLIDITTFLQSSYQLAPPNYGAYHIPQR
ncbi:MAG: cytochrome c [Pseudomonadota bacterium]